MHRPLSVQVTVSSESTLPSSLLSYLSVCLLVADVCNGSWSAGCGSGFTFPLAGQSNAFHEQHVINNQVDSSLDFCWLPLSVLSLFSLFPFFLFKIFCASCCAERWVCLFYSEWPALIRNISSCLSLSLTEQTKLLLAETSQQRQYQNETKETHTDEFRAF